MAFVPSEEDGGQGTLAAIRAGATGDMAIITEPSDLDVVVAHAGAITFRLTVPGRAAPASRRREGVSALDKLWVLARDLDWLHQQRARRAASYVGFYIDRFTTRPDQPIVENWLMGAKSRTGS